MPDSERIDKWLWTVRIFKTRNQATLACRSGKIRGDTGPVKPSHEVKTGEIITVSQPPLTKRYRVLGFPPARVGAKLVMNFCEDLTPPEEIEKLKIMRELNFELRPRGVGRPTKRERREIEILKRKWKE